MTYYDLSPRSLPCRRHDAGAQQDVGLLLIELQGLEEGLQLDDVRHAAVRLPEGHVLRCDATECHLGGERELQGEAQGRKQSSP